MTDTGLQMMEFKIPCSLVTADTTLLYLSKQNSETGWGALIPSPKLWGWAVAKMSQMCPSSILLWLALQSPCSLVTKLIAVPPFPDQTQKLKREPQSLGCGVMTVWLSCPNCCAPSCSCCDCAFKTVYVSVLITSLMRLVGTNYLWG